MQLLISRYICQLLNKQSVYKQKIDRILTSLSHLRSWQLSGLFFVPFAITTNEYIPITREQAKPLRSEMFGVQTEIIYFAVITIILTIYLNYKNEKQDYKIDEESTLKKPILFYQYSVSLMFLLFLVLICLGLYVISNSKQQGAIVECQSIDNLSFFSVFSNSEM